MKVYFNLHGDWVTLDNESDFINGYTVNMFTDKLSDRNDLNYIIDNPLILIQYNGIKYATGISNLIFESIEQ